MSPIALFRKLVLTAVLPVLWPAWSAGAAVQSYSTRVLTNADGLSNSSINCIARDSHHLMWFGTWDGLNVYNGETFTVFRPVPSDPGSISNNVVRRIVEGRGGAMWIATDRGLNRYDRASRTFRHYFTPATVANITRENSFLVAADENGDIAAWVYDTGFFVYNPATEEFDSAGGAGFPPVADMLFDDGGNLWARTLDGKIYRIERKGGSLAVQSAEQMDVPPAAALFHDTPTGRFLMQYADGETVICSLKPYHVYYTVPIPAERVTAAAFAPGKCWIGTRNGLYSYDYDTHRMSPAAENLPVISLFYDGQGILWAGTDGQGVVMLYGTRELFRTFSSRNVPQLDPAPIRAFVSDADGGLWVGTKGGGLYRFDESDEDIRVKRRFRREDGLLSNSVYALARTGGGNEIWAGTEATGLNYFDLRRGDLETLPIPEHVNLTSIYALWPENDSVLWAGTSGYGLFRLSIDRGAVPFRLAGWRQYIFDKGDPASINNNVVYALLPDGGRHLWVGTRGGGLNRLDMETGRFAHFRFSPGDPASIGGDDVISLNRDNLGRLWVGTSTGLNLLVSFDGAEARFERYTEASGIANNTIHGILADEAGGVWASTNRGLSRIDGATGGIVSYYQGDGLQNNEFSDGAYYESPGGEFYFGGIGGFNRFDPSRVQRSGYAPPLYLDSFYIDNTEVSPDDWMFERQGVRRLRIPGGVETFSFLFLPMDYLDGARCGLRYRLDGYNDNWVQLGSSRRIVFSNLPAGNYTLRVECGTADKEWPGGEYVLPITVMPPWWASWWAIAACILLGVSVTYAAYAVARNRVRMRHSLEISRLESRKAEEIHQAKLRFFTNIAHEFSTSLTLIYGPTERLLAMPETDGETRRRLRTIESNAERMQHLIQELMEFRKVETGYLSLSVEEVDIPELIRYTSDIFADAAEEKKIAFACDIEPGVGMWATDRDAVEKILFNLLSNAFKYTPAGGRVELRAEIDGADLLLSVRNTGSGIRQEEQEIVFDRFTVLERVESQAAAGHETRYGIGLALCVGLAGQLGGTISLSSTPDEYTLFRVVIPPGGGQASAAAGETKPQPEIRPSGQQVRSVMEEAPAAAGAHRETVLVIDDNPEMLELIRDILGEHYNTMTASGGDEAFALMDELLPDLIVCDIAMPGMSGVEVVERLKSNPLTRHIPVVFLTSDFSVESRIRGAEIGVDSYMTKPFHARHLLATVRQQTERKTRMREYYESPLASMETLDGRPVHKSDKEFVMKLSKIAAEYIDDPQLSADLLSSEMRLSRMQLYRRLKEVTGETPTEFIRRRRLEHAERLLKTTDMTVQEIMYLSGFNNKAYFYREFAKQYRQTPREYRTNFRKES